MDNHSPAEPVKCPYSTQRLDPQFPSIGTLKWLPWVGKDYNKTKTIVLGESHYEDGEFWQNDNPDTTRIIARKHLSGTNRVKIHTLTERTLISSDEDSVERSRRLWRSVAYFNLVRRLMSSTEERPSDEDFDKGWEVFFSLVEIFKPKVCIVLGKQSFGRLGFHLANNQSAWKANAEEFRSKEKTVNLRNKRRNLKLIFINHPTGSRGLSAFDPVKWADAIRQQEPDLKRYFEQI